MVVLLGKGQAALANIAMKSLLLATGSTDSTFITVEDLLSLEVVIVKRTNFAVIARKVDMALSARF